MTDINPTPSWAAVRQLEIGEFALGGANGNMNEQAKSLAARSELLKQYATLPYESKTGGYALGATVKLDNGDIVKSTIDGNVNDPNVNMTGWVKTNSASQIFDESGLSQQDVNDLQKEKTLSFLDFGATGDGVTDDSISIGLASTWSSVYKRPVTGLGKTYACSNVFFDSDCHLRDASLVNNANADLISVLTTAVSREWLENVTFENIHIDGKRIDQTGVKDSGLAEDGGRHGFRFRRPCRNIRIRKSSANFCAGDGICIFPDMFNGGDVVSIIDFVIEDSEFNWNRRHGGSSDRTNGLTLINTKCNFNGRYLDGYETEPQNSGAQGDKPYLKNYYYGNGWDSEEYDNHTYSSNLSFINCEMIDNAKGGLLILATAGATAVNENIKVLGGKYNKGVLNIHDNHAITITPNTVSATNVVYENVVISGVTTKDSILLRNTKNYSITDTPCILTAVEHSMGYSDGMVTLLNGAASAKNYKPLIVPVDGFKYNKQFNIFQINKIPVTEKNIDSFGAVQRDTFTKSGTACGYYEVSINSDNSTSYNFKTTEDDGGTLKVDPAGIVQKLSPYHMPTNNSEMTFDLTSDTNLRVLVKGSDGVVRSVNLTLS